MAPHSETSILSDVLRRENRNIYRPLFVIVFFLFFFSSDKFITTEVAGLERPSPGVLVYLFHAHLSGSLCKPIGFRCRCICMRAEAKLEHTHRCLAY